MAESEDLDAFIASQVLEMKNEIFALYNAEVLKLSEESSGSNTTDSHDELPF